MSILIVDDFEEQREMLAIDPEDSWLSVVAVCGVGRRGLEVFGRRGRISSIRSH